VAVTDIPTLSPNFDILYGSDSSAEAVVSNYSVAATNIPTLSHNFDIFYGSDSSSEAVVSNYSVAVTIMPTLSQNFVILYGSDSNSGDVVSNNSEDSVTVANIFSDSFSTQNSWLLEYFLINAQLFSSITIDSATSTSFSTLLALFLSIFMAIYISCVKDTTPTLLFQFNLGSYFPTEFFYGFIGFLSHSSSQVLSKISTSATSLYTRLQDIISPTHLFNRFVDF